MIGNGAFSWALGSARIVLFIDMLVFLLTNYLNLALVGDFACVRLTGQGENQSQ
ncbi:hypothetical protein [Bacillus sp. Marseille-P3661]|uniref:hypothetical protein n=1 Tax=Bacillus sp. Marseille-P3661 TaxID=1936234 RepID=UPI0015E17B65|nr:hypothetical protein [Bacillus sp. Marseille-P3661]